MIFRGIKRASRRPSGRLHLRPRSGLVRISLRVTHETLNDIIASVEFSFHDGIPLDRLLELIRVCVPLLDGLVLWNLVLGLDAVDRDLGPINSGKLFLP